MADGQIPLRTASRYAGQYAKTIDLSNIVRIFEDSVKLASTSKNEETATTRYELAIEAYHQIVAMEPPSGVSEAARATMANLASTFQQTMSLNTAQGFIDKAAKLKSAKKQLENLDSARRLLDAFMNSHPEGSQAIALKLSELRTAIGALDPTAH